MDDADDGQRHGKQLSSLEAANDVAVGEVVDDEGSIYVTGYSKSGTSGYDYLTLKYSSAGSLLWASRLDGGAKGDDRPTGIALDGHGGVIVTGASSGQGSGTDYLTVRYDAQGNIAWKRRLNGSGNGVDWPQALTADSNGNSYITGYSLSKVGGYNSLTVSYDWQGNQRWVSEYDGPMHEDDFGTAIAVGKDGSCFVGGYSKTDRDGATYLSIKLDPFGKVRWVRNFSAGRSQIAKVVGAAADESGGVCITGFAQGAHPTLDCVTLQYDTDGKAVWSRRYDGPGHGDDRPNGIVRTATGDYVVFGQTYTGAGTGQDLLVARYSHEGKVEWESHVDGSGMSDSAAAADVGPDRIVVAASSVGESTGSDILTLGMELSGKELWRQRYNSEANDSDRAVGVKLDTQGNILVLGSSWGGKLSGFDYVLIKYSKSGALLWTRRFDGKGTAK